MKDNERTEDIRQGLDARIACLRLQLTQTLTPLLRKEAQILMRLHSAALEEKDLASEANLLQNLDRLHDQFIKHWRKVYKDPLFHSFLPADMIEFQRNLTGMLLHDYVGESYNPTKWVSNRVRTIRQMKAPMKHASSDDMMLAQDSDSSDAHESHRSEAYGSDDSEAPGSDCSESHGRGRSESDGSGNDWRGGYNDGIAFPLKEMTLNVPLAHVEERLCFAESKEKEELSSAGYVADLLDRTDWKKLAQTLLNDRELASDLFSQEPMVEGYYDDKTSRKVLEGIKKIERKYFVDLSSPSEYTISKHATDLSARYSSSSSSCASLPRPEAENLTDVSKKDRVRSVISAIAGGIKGRGTASPKGNPRASPTSTNASGLDEKAVLINLDGI